MSKNIFLVKYLLDDGIPVDESSENLEKSFLPEKLNEWLIEQGFIQVIKIKEISDGEPLIPVDELNVESLSRILSFVETSLFGIIRQTNLDISQDFIITKKAVDADLDDLLVWLKIRFILNEKILKHISNSDVKIVIG